MKFENRVIRLERNGPTGVGLSEMECDPADFQSPTPSQHVHIYYSDPELGLNVGIWDTTTMQEAFGPYPGDEFVWILEGGFMMLDGIDNAVEINEGDSVCFRNAIPVSWKQEGYLKKFFITYFDPNAETPEIDSADGGVIVMNPRAELTPAVSTDPFEIRDRKPVQRNKTVFTNDTGNMSMGLWDSEAMISVMRPFPIHEFVQMLEGEITITEESGDTQIFKTRDCFFVPKGTVCSWTIEVYAKIYYGILKTSLIVSQSGQESIK